MYHFEKKHSKICSSEGPRKSVWGPCENVSPGPLWLSTYKDGSSMTALDFKDSYMTKSRGSGLGLSLEAVCLWPWSRRSRALALKMLASEFERIFDSSVQR